MKIPEKGVVPECKSCLELFKKKPAEIQFGVERDKNDNLYFTVTREDWFKNLINNRKDGIAIDIISKDRYTNASDKLDKSKIIRGYLLPPLYQKQLRSNVIHVKSPRLAIKIGSVPAELRNKEIEFNIVFIKNQYLCNYIALFNVDRFRWELLHMGLFLDSLTYNTNPDSLVSRHEYEIVRQKTMQFEIPFEQNKSYYSPKDIKPIYDSLKLTDYTIHLICINAFSSVEGDVERNKLLQTERVQSISKALQSYQKPSIVTDMQTAENWDDFMRDIKLTPYASFAKLSKDTIRKRLLEPAVVEKLEPYLKKHRKAVVTLELQKKDNFINVTVKELIGLFNRSVTNHDMVRANELQNSIFRKIEDKQASINTLDNIEIPQKIECGQLLNKNVMFKYLMKASNLKATFNEISELRKLMPTDGHVNYNYCAFKFALWRYDYKAFDPAQFRKEIEALTKYGISKGLQKRMLINFEIYRSENLMEQGDFANKDKALQFIYSNYQDIPFAEKDLLSLAQYLASYAKLDWAEKIIEKSSKKGIMNDDMLFYYLSLTISNENSLKRPEYRKLLERAYTNNRKRYCALFNSIYNGGVSLQLLENDYLRKIYCKECKANNELVQIQNKK